jgi:hypothetical protein
MFPLVMPILESVKKSEKGLYSGAAGLVETAYEVRTEKGHHYL